VDEETLIQAAATEDGRQVYADWLLERGDARGELLALEVALARTDVRDAARSGLADRLALVAAGCDPAWRARLGALAVPGALFQTAFASVGEVDLTGTHVAAAGAGQVRAWRLSDGRVVFRDDGLAAVLVQTRTHIVYERQPRYVVVAYVGGGDVLRTYTTDELPRLLPEELRRLGRVPGLPHVRFSPDGEVTASAIHGRVLLEGPSGNELLAVPSTPVGFLPDGAVIVLDGQDGQLHLHAAGRSWLRESRSEPIRVAPGPTTASAVSPDGKRVAASSGAVLHVVSLETRRLVAALALPAHARAVAVCRDLVAAAAGDSVVVWRVPY
jgi:uncharacterized protein (TIGR02996 family)